MGSQVHWLILRAAHHCWWAWRSSSQSPQQAWVQLQAWVPVWEQLQALVGSCLASVQAWESRLASVQAWVSLQVLEESYLASVSSAWEPVGVQGLRQVQAWVTVCAGPRLGSATWKEKQEGHLSTWTTRKDSGLFFPLPVCSKRYSGKTFENYAIPVARDCAGAEVGGRAETETGAETGAGAGACACSAPKAISSLIHSKCPPSVAHMSAVNPSLLSALLSIPCCKNQRRIGTRPRRADACSAVVPPIVRARIMSFPQSRTSSSHAAWLSSATASHRSWTCSLENPLKCIEARKLVIECTGPWFARLAAGIVWIEGIEKEVDRRGWAAGSGTGCGGIAACHDASGTGCGALRPTGWFPWRVGWAAGALCGPTG
eukprot:m.68661 g.68661  ORF g.68661 m.68661 type:complete len:373 (-) comp50013_c0_seq35:2107-3225(-)